ncbi:MAG: SCP2 sterol-binding domain-containing protein [Alphaproteobacteria bacterium]|nr:SCP2 sterol-binding domain-containing protein [Alphaproteobacteria bacterium]
MADVKAFFEDYLPSKLAKNPSIASDINGVYQFNLGDEGNWVVDLTKDGGAISAGDHESPNCVVTAQGSDFGKLLDNPASAMMLFTMGKLKVSDIAMGMKLQKLLG